jgi:fructosamine-3-kinase
MTPAPRYTKTQPGAPADFFTAEARGLDRLRVPGGPPIPAVHSVAPDRLVIDLIATGRPSLAAASRFGRRLAVMHQAGGPAYGADADGYVATIRLDNTPVSSCPTVPHAPNGEGEKVRNARFGDSWAEFHAVRRLIPALALARDAGAIAPDDAALVERVIEALPELAGPPEPPARIHGDLWAGNLLWSVDGEVWLIAAAAACDGHRETDLAMLALFGAPMLGDILAAYDDAYSLSSGWEQRVALHQLHPLLVHAVLFGRHYGAQAGAAARRAIG